MALRVSSGGLYMRSRSFAAAAAALLLAWGGSASAHDETYPIPGDSISIDVPAPESASWWRRNSPL